MWLTEWQQWLYSNMAEGMRSVSDLSAVPIFAVGAFTFGMLHALMPGHGKSVLVSYHLGREGRLVDGLITASLLSITHVGLAIIFVLAGVAIISKSVALAGRAPAFDALSAGLILLAGCFLLWQALRRKPHLHEVTRGPLLAFFTGLVPCPLTTFILAYAFSNQQVALGFAAVVAMLLGIITTIGTFAVSAVLARDWLAGLFIRNERQMLQFGCLLEVASAVMVMALGAIMFLRSMRWLVT